jgi:hypothetical protein
MKLWAERPDCFASAWMRARSLGGKRIVVVSAMSQALHRVPRTTFVALMNCARKQLT